MYCFLKACHYLIQADLKTKDNQVTDLQEILKTQQAETAKAKEELSSALGIMEQLRESRKKEQADWATEKAALIKRAENAEAALKPVVDEISAVKRQVHAMTSAIFGKLPLSPFSCMIPWPSYNRFGL